MKPGSCGPGVLGIYPVIWDEDGSEITAGRGKAGNICIRNPWPGTFQTIWGDPDRYLDTYYRKYCKSPGSKDWRDYHVQAQKAAHGEVPRELTAEEAAEIKAFGQAE